MKKVFACTVAVGLMGWVPSLAADTWKGKISDAMCGAKHAEGEHGTKKMTDRQCVEACVKGGEKYVFVSDGDKVLTIANQDFDGLKVHAGHEVMLTGDLKGDTITVTKIEMPKK
jgi:hypothetical protein